MWCKEGMRPPDVPSSPSRTYKDSGWQGWGHWLGTGSQSNKTKAAQLLPFDEALRVARQLRLVGQTEWNLWCGSGGCPANLGRSTVSTTQTSTRHQHWLRNASPRSARRQRRESRAGATVGAELVPPAGSCAIADPKRQWAWCCRHHFLCPLHPFDASGNDFSYFGSTGTRSYKHKHSIKRLPSQKRMCRLHKFRVL